MSASAAYDAIVVGGGHNGLVAGAYLARSGRRTVVLERRPIVGGAAVTEQPWGPDYRVTSLSYVVSLLPPQILRDLDLERHGYHVYPQGPYYVPYPDGRCLQVPDDPARRRASIGAFSSHDADAYERWEAWLCSVADVLGPLLTAVPPTLGSRRGRDVAAQARLAWSLRRRLDPARVTDLTRLFTLSIADLLDEHFESPEMQGVLSVSGVIGTWAGPRSPGTAFVMAHHQIGDVGGEQLGQWGFPRGGMGAVTQAMASAARSFGAEVRTDVDVARILVGDDGAVRGVALADGTELRAPIVVSAIHPAIAFGRLVERRHLPDAFARDIDRWRSRSGTVKINVAVDRLPAFCSHPSFDPEVHGGTIVLARSLDEVETAFQDAVAGRAAQRPFADICIPSVFDDSLAPPGHHVVSMFTQWVPHTWSAEPHRAELEAYADRVVALFDEVAPGFCDSILHRNVIGPYEMEHTYGLVGGNIFHGELSPSQLFHLRPSNGWSDYRTPVRGLYHASSATHGGGGVTGIPALQAYRAIESDARRGVRRRRGSRRFSVR